MLRESHRMEQLTVLEKICNNLFDSMECGTATYIFAAAIYGYLVLERY